MQSKMADVDEEKLEQDLIKWLADGPYVSSEDHAASARALKIAYGMRPRK